MEYSRYEYDDHGIQVRQLNYDGENKYESRIEVIRDEFDNIIGTKEEVKRNGKLTSTFEKKYNYAKIGDKFYNTYSESITNGKSYGPCYTEYDKDENGELIPVIKMRSTKFELSDTETIENYENGNLVHRIHYYQDDPEEGQEKGRIIKVETNLEKPDAHYTPGISTYSDRETGELLWTEETRRADDFEEHSKEHYVGYKSLPGKESELFYEVTYEETQEKDKDILDCTTRMLNSENKWVDFFNRNIKYKIEGKIMQMDDLQYINNELVFETIAELYGEKWYTVYERRISDEGEFVLNTTYTKDHKLKKFSKLKKGKPDEFGDKVIDKIVEKKEYIYDRNGGILMITEQQHDLYGHKIFIREGRMEKIITETSMLINEYNDDNNIVVTMSTKDFPKELFDYYYNEVVNYVVDMELEEMGCKE